MARRRTRPSGATVEDLLGPLEAQCMRALWRHTPATVSDVLAAVNEQHDPELAYTTVMTVLSRLHDKGYVTREREGRSYTYEPAFEERELIQLLSRRDVDALVDRYGHAALAQFADALRRADPELLQRAAQTAAEGQEGGGDGA